MGRPPKFSSPEDLQAQIASFFDYHKEFGTMPTKGNLALYLDTTRETLGDYEKKEGYSDTIKETYARIEDRWVQSLNQAHVAGIIFYMKNAFSYSDKRELDHTSGGKPMFLPSEVMSKYAVTSSAEKDSPGQPPLQGS